MKARTSASSSSVEPFVMAPWGRILRAFARVGADELDGEIAVDGDLQQGVTVARMGLGFPAGSSRKGIAAWGNA